MENKSKRNSPRDYPLIVNPEISKAILFAPFCNDDRVKMVSDYMIIRSISPFMLILRRSAAIIASQFVPGLVATRKKKRGGGRGSASICTFRAHSHPGSDRNDLNACEVPEECRSAYEPRLPRDDLFIFSIVRSACEENTVWRNHDVVRHASIFINVILGPRDSDRLTLRLATLYSLDHGDFED